MGGSTATESSNDIINIQQANESSSDTTIIKDQADENMDATDFKSGHSNDNKEEKKEENVEMDADFEEPAQVDANTHIASFQLDQS